MGFAHIHKHEFVLKRVKITDKSANPTVHKAQRATVIHSPKSPSH